MIILPDNEDCWVLLLKRRIEPKDFCCQSSVFLSFILLLRTATVLGSTSDGSDEEPSVE